MSLHTDIPAGGVPEGFVATLGALDGLIPAPWHASYVISVSMTGGVRFMYAIDRAATLPWCWRIPAALERRRALARMVISSGILRARTTASDTETGGHRGGAWLCASAGPLRRVVPLGSVPGGSEIAEAFGALVPSSVWAAIAERRGRFLATHTGDGGQGRGVLRGRLGGDGR